MKTREALYPYRFRLIGGLVGLILAILFLDDWLWSDDPHRCLRSDRILDWEVARWCA